jgi:anti-sigma factor (TIGR02949 family)
VSTGVTTCADAETRLQSYVDRVLTPTEVGEIEAHLAACPSCARCYQLEQDIRAQLKAACSEPCPESLKMRLRNLCAECDCDDDR